MSRARRLASTLVIAALLAVGLVACSDDDPDPQEVAAAFADGLQNGKIGPQVADPEAATAELTSILGEMAPFDRTVAASVVQAVQGDPDSRDIPLLWTYAMGDGADSFTLRTTARITLLPSQEWQVRWDPAVVHPDATSESTFTVRLTQAGRGDIRGTGTSRIVYDRPVHRIGIDKTRVPEEADVVTAATALAEALELDAPEAYVQRVRDAGHSAFVIALTIRASDAESYGVEELREIEGVLVLDDELPLAPSATWARPVLGAVGEATAEIIEESRGQIRVGDLVGTSGLQRLYDARLRGTAGVEVTLAGTRAGDLALYRSAPIDGTDLRTSLDLGLQTIAEDALADIDSASALVAIQASTGQVLAAASGPGSAGLSTATLGQYPPGSTFKVVTALALLRAGLTADSPVTCAPTITVDGRTFRNYPGYPASSEGQITLREAFAQSCNTALIDQAALVGGEELALAAASLGVGATMPDGVPWPAPYFSGSVPADADGTAHAAAMIGQGEVLVSPMAMAGVAASVAAGRTITPSLLIDAEDAEPPALELTAAEGEALRELMFAVVNDGTSTFLQGLPGAPVGAKSGTAQYGTGDPPPTHAWMIAFQGDLAVVVFVEEGDYGTATAGPVLRSFLQQADAEPWLSRL